MTNSRARQAPRLGVAARWPAVLRSHFWISNSVPLPLRRRRRGASRPVEPGILRATLPNGLRVDSRSAARWRPGLATSVNYLVGSNDAPDGFPGTAHALEHVMFRGSPSPSADELANIGNDHRRYFNANTRENLTQYLFTVSPSDHIELALRVEATRMQGLLVDPADQHERGAIEQEVAQDLSNPNYLLFEDCARFSSPARPMSMMRSAPGRLSKKTTAKMLKDFYNKAGTPENAILVMAGNLDPQATLTKICTIFGGIPRKALGMICRSIPSRLWRRRPS